MSSEKSDAIILRVIAWSETSCIVTMLTRDFGKTSALAKGARRPKSPFEAALDLLSVCRIVFIPKSSDSLDLLTEAKLLRRFRSAQRDLGRLYCGYYVSELLGAFTEPGQSLDELYDLSDLTLLRLDGSQDTADTMVSFELHLLRLLGHLPSLDVCAGCGEGFERSKSVAFGLNAGGILCPNCGPGQRNVLRLHTVTIEVLNEIASNDWRSESMVAIPKEFRGEVRGCMNRYLSFLLDRTILLQPYLEDLAR